MFTVKDKFTDSENDEDYMPPGQEDADSSDESEPETKCARTQSPQTVEQDEDAKKRARQALWSKFEESVSTPGASTSGAELVAKKMVQIEKRYLFAGKEVIQVMEVPEDSLDAKKWFSQMAPEASETNSTNIEQDRVQAPPNLLPPKKASKRPGPRKPKTSLAAIPASSNAKKITTLEKSAMDWRNHLQTERDSGLTDELEANRRGGGYLEKVDFLKRVNERKEDNLENLESSKRRRI